MGSKMHEQFYFVCKVVAVKPKHFIEKKIVMTGASQIPILQAICFSIGNSHLIHTWIQIAHASFGSPNFLSFLIHWRIFRKYPQL